MKKHIKGTGLGRALWNELSQENMLRTIKYFNGLHRYTSSVDGEKAVGYIAKKLDEYGVAYDLMNYEGYLSIPNKSELRVLEPVQICIPAIASVYSLEAHMLRGTLHYDAGSQDMQRDENQYARRTAPFAGKVVLTHECGIAMAMRAADAGAAALIQMWPSADPLPHHGSIGAAWGAPSPEEARLIPWLPVVQVTKDGGEALIALCEAGDVRIELSVQMDTGVRESSMPVADIPGKSGKYVLVASHYDSWYEGITDNAVANAIMLDMTRVFNAHRDELLHGIKFAWWGGHSDGRYGGSTWYCDNRWEDLNANCAAYIYLDICGCKNTGRIVPRGSMMEGPDFLRDIIEELTGERHEGYVPMTKTGDQSFFGAGIPLQLYGMGAPGPGGDTNFKNVGGGPWWHTVEDTLDKMDAELMMRDAKFNTYLAAYICTASRIPADMAYFVSRMQEFLRELDAKVSAVSLAPALSAFEALARKVKELEAALTACGDDRLANEIICRTAGDIARIAYSSTDPYHHDPAWLPGKTPPFCMMNLSAGVTPDNCPETLYFFHKTRLQRLCNRIVGEAGYVIRQIGHQLLQLREAEERTRV